MGFHSELPIVKDKLNTGKFTIVDTFAEQYPNGLNTMFVLLGKIKK